MKHNSWLDILPSLALLTEQKPKQKTTANKGVCNTCATLPFTFESILGQKKNYGNSNIFTMRQYNLQKIL
jgi:hypothetical protein